MRCLVASDISDDATRERVANYLLQFGIRVQYSVFECELSGPQRAEVERFVSSRIDLISDSTLVLPMCEACRSDATELGAVPDTLDEPYYIV